MPVLSGNSSLKTQTTAFSKFLVKSEVIQNLFKEEGFVTTFFAFGKAISENWSKPIFSQRIIWPENFLKTLRKTDATVFSKVFLKSEVVQISLKEHASSEAFLAFKNCLVNNVLEDRSVNFRKNSARSWFLRNLEALSIKLEVNQE